MIVTIVILLTMMSLLGGGTYIAFSAYEAISARNSLMINSQRGEQARLAVINHSIYDVETGIYSIPGPFLSSSEWSTLPEWLGSFYHSGSGVPFLYCPFNLATGLGSPSVVTLPDSSSYSVGISSVAGRDYVSSSLYQKDDLIAAIVSPAANNREMPSCQDITKNNGRYSVPGGQVWTIDAADMFNHSAVVGGGQANFYVLPDGGDGYPNGRSLSLVDNLSYIKSGGVSSHVIHLHMAPGEYLINDVDANVFEWAMDDLKAKKLVIRSSGPEKAIIRHNDGTTLRMDIPGVDIVMENITFEGDIVFDGGVVNMDNIEAHTVNATDSEIIASDIVITSDIINSVWLSGADLKARNSLQVSGGIVLHNASEISLNNSSASVVSSASHGGILLRQGSKVSIFNSTLNITNNLTREFGIDILQSSHLLIDNSELFFTGAYESVVRNNGKMTKTGGSILLSGSASIGIEGGNASDLFINESNMFIFYDRPTEGVRDAGGMHLVGGDTSQWSAVVSCWTGEIFADSSLTQSQPDPVSLDSVNNKSSWTCL